MTTTMRIRNMTPHPVGIQLANGERLTIAPDPEGPARLIPAPRTEVHLSNVPVPVVPLPSFLRVEGLPPPEVGTIYLVSLLALDAIVGRLDVFAPATGPDDGVIRKLPDGSEGPGKTGVPVAVVRLVGHV